MKELFSSLTEAFNERVKSPLFGTFILSWMIYNWQLFVLLFGSDEPIETTIRTMQLNMIEWDSYSIPLIFTLLYIFASPWIFLKIEEWTFEAKVQRKEQLYELQIEYNNSKVELVKSEVQLEIERAEHKGRKELNDKIVALEEEVSNYGEMVPDLHEENSRLQNELDKKQLEISRKIDTIRNLEENLDKNKSNELESKQKSQIPLGAFKKFHDSALYKYFGSIGAGVRSENGYLLDQSVKRIVIEKYLAEEILIEKKNVAGNSYYVFSPKGTYFWKEYIKLQKIN